MRAGAAFFIGILLLQRIVFDGLFCANSLKLAQTRSEALSLSCVRRKKSPSPLIPFLWYDMGIPKREDAIEPMNIELILTGEFNLKPDHVKNIVELVDAGNTIPFIARYRKEMTGSCDDQVLRELHERLEYLRGLEKRQGEIIASIEEQGKMTGELMAAIGDAKTLARLEDIYRPYKPKRRTRGMIAREKGLEPLARTLLAQDMREGDLWALALLYLSEENEVLSAEEALAGARDIIAEDISDDAAVREALRRLFWSTGKILCRATKEEDSVYRMYYEYEEAASKIPSHRVLAVNRGEKDGFLKVSLAVDEALCLDSLYRRFVREGSITSEAVRMAADDAFKRLIAPSLERELRSDLTERASEQAIKNFGINLKALLMQPPVKGKVALGFDPAYRTGCKLAVVDGTGKALETTVIYPTPPQNKTAEAKEKLLELIRRHQIDVIAIGNGTASKESEIFVAQVIKEASRPVAYMMVNEAGASVYSASKLAAQEFPEYDVSLRSAVSIARRLQDPLAELVKIDPKSVGVGQYQHDMPEKRLDETLTGVVEDCVNQVGVDLNTASASLLTYIAGLSGTVAKNIVAFRDEKGVFHSRKELLKIPKLGPKAFEQCAGFLRIPEADNVLDNTAVHPESYGAAENLLKLFGYKASDIGSAELRQLPEQIRAKGENQVAEACGVGVPTLRDMVGELLRPGRDLRDDLPAPQLRTDVMSMEDLKPGMELQGTVRNVIDFGVFVDIGVHQDGLVHISEVCNRYIKHPSEVVKVGDPVTVWVLAVDVPKKRISLTMKRKPSPVE